MNPNPEERSTPTDSELPDLGSIGAPKNAADDEHGQGFFFNSSENSDDEKHGCDFLFDSLENSDDEETESSDDLEGVLDLLPSPSTSDSDSSEEENHSTTDEYADFPPLPWNLRGRSLLSDDDEDESLCPELSLSPSSSSSSHGPQIADEQFGPVLPKLPLKTYEKQGKKYYTHAGELKFNDLSFFEAIDFSESSVNAHAIDIEGFKATLYSTKEMPAAYDRVMFMMHGDKANDIYIHASQAMRTIIILSQAQYACFPTHYLANVDCLVLLDMESPTHGNFNQYLDKEAAQITAAFITSHFLGLTCFLIGNANLKSIGYKPEENDEGAISVFNLLKARMANSAVIAIPKNYHREVKPSNLGIDFFMVNMEPIKARLPSAQHMYYLMPQSSDANNWTAIFYFQLVLDDLFENGRMMLSRRDAAVTTHRVSKYEYAIEEEPISDLTTFTQNIPGEDAAHIQYIITQTVAKINKIIAYNRADYHARRAKITDGNIFKFHWDVQRLGGQTSDLPTEHEPVVEVRHGEAFIPHFKTKLRHMLQETDLTILRDYQRDALNHVTNFSGSTGHLVIPTGCGKTLMTYLMVRAAWLSTNTPEVICVVVPQLSLLRQLYSDFYNYYYMWFKEIEKTNPTFSFDQILTVSSLNTSVSHNLLDKNKLAQSKKKILLFCFESFRKYINSESTDRHQAKLLIADEFHMHTRRYSDILKNINTNDTYTIGLSATPPENNPLGDEIFSYPLARAIEAGFLPPIVSDSLDADFSKDAMIDLTEYLPLLLERYHPGYSTPKRLKEQVGIVFLPNREDCDELVKNMETATINAMAVYSGSRRTIDDANKIKEGLVIASVRSLRQGYDNPHIAYVVIAQNLSDQDKAEIGLYLEQMVGRAVRRSPDDPNKIAYVITFNNIVPSIPEALRTSVLTVTPHQAYLQQSDTYYYPTSDGKWASTEAPEEIPSETPPERIVRFGVNDPRLVSSPNASASTPLDSSIPATFSSLAPSAALTTTQEPMTNLTSDPLDHRASDNSSSDDSPSDTSFFPSRSPVTPSTGFLPRDTQPELDNWSSDDSPADSPPTPLPITRSPETRPRDTQPELDNWSSDDSPADSPPTPLPITRSPESRPRDTQSELDNWASDDSSSDDCPSDTWFPSPRLLMTRSPESRPRDTPSENVVELSLNLRLEDSSSDDNSSDPRSPEFQPSDTDDDTSSDTSCPLLPITRSPEFSLSDIDEEDTDNCLPRTPPIPTTTVFAGLFSRTYQAKRPGPSGPDDSAGNNVDTPDSSSSSQGAPKEPKRQRLLQSGANTSSLFGNLYPAPQATDTVSDDAQHTKVSSPSRRVPKI